jgi:hypothetical protein
MFQALRHTHVSALIAASVDVALLFGLVSDLLIGGAAGYTGAAG